MSKLPPPAEFLEARGYLTVNQLVEYLREHYPLKALSYPALRRQVGKTLQGEQAGGQLRITRESILRYVGKEGASPLPTLPGPVVDSTPPTVSIGPGIKALIEENLRITKHTTPKRAPVDTNDDEDGDGSEVAQPPRTLAIPDPPLARPGGPRLVPPVFDDDD